MNTDVLVIGSGIAGLSFALKVSRFSDVIIVTKSDIKESNTKYAQGGLAVVLGKDDSFDEHIKNTLRAGDGLCDEKAASILVKGAPEEIAWLKENGAIFDKELSKEAVHSKKRIIHSGDITGEMIEDLLVGLVRKNKRIKVLEYNQAIGLLVHNNICDGINVFDIKENRIIEIKSKSVVLSTGGLGRVYKNTCNPDVATGDGFAIAYESGAELEDMEFVQFHPTGLYKSNPVFLISETLRGEGGHLRNKYGEIYMPKYHRDGELAPRDVVSKFSFDEMKKTKTDHVYLDVTHMDPDYLKKRFPKIYKRCLEYGIDLTKDMIPVTPTAHYSCGGVKIDLDCKTTVEGLYAIGEVSCSGAHGADRLASNSLVDGLVFGSRLSNLLKGKIKINSENINNKINKKNIDEKNINDGKVDKNEIERIKKELQELMLDNVGIIRNEKGLKEALEKISKLEKKLSAIEGLDKDLFELKNMVVVSKVITRAALERKESRGTHFIEEYPARDDSKWKRHSVLSKKGIKFV